MTTCVLRTVGKLRIDHGTTICWTTFVVVRLTHVACMSPFPLPGTFLLGVALASVGCATAEQLVPVEAAVGDSAADSASAGLDGGTVLVDAGAADAASTPVLPAADAAAGAMSTTCLSDADCQLVNDCCRCQAIPSGEKVAACDPQRSCVTLVCAQYQGIETARCSAGRCILGFDCDTTKVLCKRVAPLCPPGQVPLVAGQCYGECVDARQCLTVPSCASCQPADTCVRRPSSPQTLHCLAAAVITAPAILSGPPTAVTEK